MNSYGAQALNHWRQNRPHEYSQIPDPQRHFSSLGNQIELQIEQLTASLAGEDPPGEPYLSKLTRLQQARTTAERQVLSDLVYGNNTAEEEPQTRTEPRWEPITISPSEPA